MFKSPLIRSAGTAVLAATLSFSPALQAAEAPKVDSPAPAFTVTDLEGKQHSLAGFKGKVVVLEWNNFDCPFVARHYKSGNLPALQKKAVADGVVWLAVNSSAEGKQGFYAPEAMKARAGKEGFAGTAYVYDTPGTAGKAYGAPATPTMAVIDAGGVLRYWGALDDKPQGGEGAVNYVTAALEALAAGTEVAVKSTKPYGCGVKY
jgi:hypothetical protein